MVLIDMKKPLSCGECRFCEYEQGYCTALPFAEWREITDMSECPLQECKKCKDCKNFETDVLVPCDDIPLIIGHEVCTKWGGGCRTKEDGYCFLFEPKEEQ